MISLGLAGASLDDIKAQTDAGAKLFELKIGPHTVCAFVLRVDHEAAQRVGVLVIAGANYGGYDLTAGVVPMVEKMFLAAGCTQVRIHTGRHGMARKLHKLNYEIAELVLTKDI